MDAQRSKNDFEHFIKLIIFSWIVTLKQLSVFTVNNLSPNFRVAPLFVNEHSHVTHVHEF